MVTAGSDSALAQENAEKTVSARGISADKGASSSGLGAAPSDGDSGAPSVTVGAKGLRYSSWVIIPRVSLFCV